MNINLENKDEWKLVLNSLTASYNHERYDLEKQAMQYYRQHATSTYVTEEELIDRLTKLKELKNDILYIQELILGESSKAIRNEKFNKFGEPVSVLHPVYQ